MKVLGMGVDIAEISRFRAELASGNDHFFETLFSEHERSRCRSHADPAPHLAGLFAAKEAVRKATGDFISEHEALEIRPDARGKPELWANGIRSDSVLITITHGAEVACAVALYQGNDDI